MTDSTLKKLEDEICRGLDELSSLDPDSEAYQKLSDKLIKMAGIINKDEAIRNKLTIDREKLDAQANMAALKRGADSEKFEREQIQRDRETKLNCWLTIGTCAVSLISFIGTWIANGVSQARSEHFEETGHCYTSRFSRFQIKEPNHPNPTVRK